ncbi:serine/threonine-protein kinase [Streptomyces sp. NBC_01334]|uniref:serine/threonine-protein kinase n=1 Tax=Streptomyces sp. NBC_01334 TaxID=2903827 RepID=UPI002E10E44D|nr:serine/threonine-protein kinase [Streptomyces sp. NBC_01334]
MKDQVAMTAGVPPINFVAHQIRTGGMGGAREDFDKMITDLANATMPGVRTIAANPADWGIDAFAGDLGGSITVWQSKYFHPVTAGTSHQKMIRESFQSLMKQAAQRGYTVQTWVLCIPSSMDGPTSKWWATWKKTQEREHGLLIDLWDETEITRRLRTPEADRVRRAYYEPFMTTSIADAEDEDGLLVGDEDGAVAFDSSLLARQIRDAGHVELVGDLAQVLRGGCGDRRDYARDRLPIPDGGQADVFHARHKKSGVSVAVKQLRGQHPHRRQIARMKREIEIGLILNGHPHAVPILDYDRSYTWFVMPFTETTATLCREEFTELPALTALLEAICSVLAPAHQQGWVHRDIKPANVLRLDGRWALADWGIVRRPRGQTTDPQRTKLGAFLGSDGFGAPELSDDAHSVTPATDIYSLGQLIGWAITGEMPLMNVPLVPASGPWRAVVREATHRDPARRPTTIGAFLQLISQETQTPAQPPILRAEALKEAAVEGSTAATHELVALAAAHTGDASLYCDLLVTVPPTALMSALLANPHRAVDIVRAMAELLGTHRSPERGEVDAAIMWLIEIAQQAAAVGELELLEECCNGAFEWDAQWDQWTPQAKIAPWLSTVTGDVASAVAATLRQHPVSAGHFRHLADNIRTDHRIRAAVSRP